MALTFDACQTEGDLAGYDSGIVQVLADTRTPATFFLGGLWMRDHPEQTLELADNPLFEISSHSWSHPDFTQITPAQMSQEIRRTQKEMWKLLGRQGRLFRFPYGTYTDQALQVVAENGLVPIQWEVVSGDPDPNIDAERMAAGVLEGVQPGSIVIMHANGRGWHTAEALPQIIQGLRQAGYTFVTVSQLLGLQ